MKTFFILSSLLTLSFAATPRCFKNNPCTTSLKCIDDTRVASCDIETDANCKGFCVPDIAPYCGSCADGEFCLGVQKEELGYCVSEKTTFLRRRVRRAGNYGKNVEVESEAEDLEKRAGNYGKNVEVESEAEDLEKRAGNYGKNVEVENVAEGDDDEE
ncbi:hypothetical protein P280DRAFT_471631 [Massarina eburnea CBS 473.64]|uniref:ShKT domain-containing protein n=1 Tax=Massarina eburnea CBS 473.64 TaxID=1395130 RepID=A0A6A6RR93_9PLEO|nr:hypothetical protein P280DRAFT_471631 [Massarina eburnea CBS 473.64]